MVRGTTGAVQLVTVRSFGRSRRRVLGLIAASTVLSLVVPALAPAASLPSTSVVLTAPYKGTHVDRSFDFTLAGCATGKVVKVPYFYQKNGTAGFQDRAATAKCSLPGNNEAIAEGEVDVLIPIPIASNGSHSIVVKWIFNVTESATATLGHCVLNLSAPTTYCIQIVEAYFSEYTYLLDATTGTSSVATNFWAGLSNQEINETEHASGYFNYSSINPGSSTFAGTVSTFFNATGMVTTHHYWIVVKLSGGALSEFVTYHAQIVGGQVGHAKVNFATRGNGGLLSSITIS